MVLTILPLLATSCSKENEVTTSNDYCYINSVVLGNIKLQNKSVNGYFSGADYLMTINQRTGIIENRDSLPYGSQLSRVLATITFNGSILKYRTQNSSDWSIYNSVDSLDLTETLLLQLTSNDNNSTRDYTLKVNVHQQEGDSLYWKQCEDENTDQLGGVTDMKAFVQDSKLKVLAQKTAGIVLLERSGINATGSWEEFTTDLPAEADLQTLCLQEGTSYISTADGKILSSNDNKTWTQTGSTYTTPLTLFEKTENYFYAISVKETGSNTTICKLLRSTDAATWEEDKLDSDAAFLPTHGIRALTVQQANGNTRIVMVGQKNSEAGEEGHNNALVWTKIWNEGEKEADTEWLFFPLSPDNDIPCPRLAYLNLLSYDNKCIAFGGASTDGTHKALDAMYISPDYGITWRPDKELHMPFELKGTENCITSTVDENNFIWIITNAQVWRGRLNRLGFVQQ